MKLSNTNSYFDVNFFLIFKSAGRVQLRHNNFPSVYSEEQKENAWIFSLKRDRVLND